jgi:aspartokinase
MCAQLGKYKINIMCISTSISSISCVIRETDLADAKKALLEAFEMPD